MEDKYRIHYLKYEKTLPEIGKDIIIYETYDDGTIFHETCIYEEESQLGWAFAWRYIEDEEYFSNLY